MLLRLRKFYTINKAIIFASYCCIFICTGHIHSANALPKNVIIIRHADKIPGKNELDLRGFERAAALAYYFRGTPKYNDPAPTFIFAAALDDSDSSVRPIQTCTPIANHYHLDMNIDFKPKETTELAKEILTNPKYAKATILICWEHHNIRPLTIAFGAADPGFWDHNIYDLVYMLNYDNGPKPTFEKILQKLMFGDRATFNDLAPPLPPPSKKNVDEN